MPADVSDFSASYYNPAGLAKARSLEMSIGYFRADSSLYMNGQNSGVDPVKGRGRRRRRSRQGLWAALRHRRGPAPAR